MSITELFAIVASVTGVVTVVTVAWVVLRSTAASTATRITKDLNDALQRQVNQLEGELDRERRKTAFAEQEFGACKKRLEGLERLVIREFEAGGLKRRVQQLEDEMKRRGGSDN